MTENSISFVGQHKAVGGPLEKGVANGLLERTEAPPHRRLRLTKLPRRGAKSALAGHSQEDSEIAPLRLTHPTSPNRSAWISCTIVYFHAGLK
jgi:hypothetical protein